VFEVGLVIPEARNIVSVDNVSPIDGRPLGTVIIFNCVCSCDCEEKRKNFIVSNKTEFEKDFFVAFIEENLLLSV
jgi:hypothetical protein